MHSVNWSNVWVGGTSYNCSIKMRRSWLPVGITTIFLSVWILWVLLISIGRHLKEPQSTKTFLMQYEHSETVNQFSGLVCMSSSKEQEVEVIPNHSSIYLTGLYNRLSHLPFFPNLSSLTHHPSVTPSHKLLRDPFLQLPSCEADCSGYGRISHEL